MRQPKRPPMWSGAVFLLVEGIQFYLQSEYSMQQIRMQCIGVRLFACVVTCCYNADNAQVLCD